MNELDNNINAGQSQNNEWIDAQYPFDGEWMPDVDPALIGPNNFAEIKNLRYNDRSIEGINGYAVVNSTALGQIYMRSGIQLRTNRTVNSFVLAHVTDDDASPGRVYINTAGLDQVSNFVGTGGETAENIDPLGKPSSKLHYITDNSANLTPRFAMAPQNSVVYCNEEDTRIFSGYEHRVAAVFMANASQTDIIDATEDITNGDTNTSYTIDSAPSLEDERSEIIIMTTRPVQGFKFYVSSANVSASTMTVQYWNGSAWTAVNDLDDDTDTGATLAQTGFVRFAHTGGNADGAGSLGTYAEFKHFQELYLYAYRVTIDAGNASIYHITCDPGFQPVQNVWDGVYRQPIQCQLWNNSKSTFEDYTLQVNVSSDMQYPVGAQIDGMQGDPTAGDADYLIVMFEERMSAIRITMLGSLVNENAATMQVYYWDGEDWASVGGTDGTGEGGVSLSQSGLVSWTPPTASEHKQTLFNSLGYAYRISFNTTLSGTEDNDEDVLIDFITGIPALTDFNDLHQTRPFRFATNFQNRLMLGGYIQGNEGNRMDYSVTNAPDVFNGAESSMDGRQSLYFGGVEPLTCASPLYNRFGASVYSMLTVFKDTEIFLMVGYNPSNFVIYPVSNTVGCPAPHTLDTAEIGIEIGQGLTRNIAIWLSHYGPMMFDGAVLKPLIGINNYFDPNESDYINWDAIDKFRGWIDQTYKEYNLLICTGSATTPNRWLCYDLIRKKWYQKDPGNAPFPLFGMSIMDPDTGEHMVYGGINTGTMIHLEKGTSWNCTYADETSGDSIEQTVKVGDVFPSNNIWDETLIRKFKLICQKVPSTVNLTNQTLSIDYYGDTNTESSNVSFQDSNAAAGVNVDFEDLDAAGDGEYETQWESANVATTNIQLGVGLKRLIRVISDMNASNWIHSFRFSISTNNVDKGWQPVMWGIRYRIERKDDTATTISEV